MDLRYGGVRDAIDKLGNQDKVKESLKTFSLKSMRKWQHIGNKSYMFYFPRNIKTPTMLLKGEDDYRTPMAESEQFYSGLKINKVESMLVRIPGASHGIASRPSNLIARVNAIIAWFEKYKK
jgi:dipeptidyl aminopeptidase/acylaminoacyl peptidase